MNSQVLKEALGVPENITKVAEDAYSRILNWVKRLDKSDFEDGHGANTELRVDFRIADYHFTRLKLKLGVDEHPKVIEPEMISMAIRSQSKKTLDLKLEPIKLKTVDLVMVMVVPEGYDFSELPDYFISNKNEIINNLSHEFKHVYDHFKKKFEYPSERAEYQASINMGFGLEALDRFVHDIYFTSANENLVRPSEVASAIQTGEISQKEFLNFLMANDTYRNLKRISEFNIENFKKEILKDKKNLNKMLKKVKFNPSEMTDEEKIESAFNILFSTLTNAKIENFKEILTHHFMEHLLGFQGEKRKVFERFVRRNTRFKSAEEFVNSYGKYFNFIGNQMIKKISKLYAMTNK